MNAECFISGDQNKRSILQSAMTEYETAKL